ncbi:MAG: ABC transporter substrate-binding protein [Caldilinea sp.]
MSIQQSNRLSRRDFLRWSGATAAVLAVAACAPSAPAPQSGTGADASAAPSAEKTVLRMQVNPEQEKPVVDMYRAINPNVDFEFVSVTGIDHEEVAAKILTLVASGQALDLGYAATEATQLYAGQKLAAPIDEWVKRDAAELQEYFADVHPSLIQAMMWEGSLYQLPIDFNAANMYYNTAVLQEAGVEAPKTDWTKDDFYNIARATTKKNASGATETYGYAWTNRLWGGWMPWIFVNGSNLLVEEEAPGGEWLWSQFYANDPAAQGRGGGWRWTAPKANDPANVEALEFLVQLYDEGITPAIELGGGETLQGFFTTGKLAMTPAGGFWAGGLNNAGMPNGSFDVQLMPKWKNQRHQFGTAGQWIFADGKNKDAAWDYMKFRISKDAMMANGMFNPVTLTTPTRRSMLTAERFAETGPANWQVFYATLDEHPDTAPIPAPSVSNPMTATFVAYTSRAMNGEMTPQAALDGMQKDLEDLYARTPNMYSQSS